MLKYDREYIILLVQLFQAKFSLSFYWFNFFNQSSVYHFTGSTLLSKIQFIILQGYHFCWGYHFTSSKKKTPAALIILPGYHFTRTTCCVFIFRSIILLGYHFTSNFGLSFYRFIILLQIWVYHFISQLLRIQTTFIILQGSFFVPFIIFQVHFSYCLSFYRFIFVVQILLKTSIYHWKP